jgi:hypothetical protein
VVEIILQYILMLLLVTGLGYLVYLLRDEGINIVDDYFGLAYVILGSLSDGEATVENVKKIIRIISKTVQYVETNYKNSENTFKEVEAIKIAKHAISLLNFKSNIDDESLRYLVRLAATLLPSKTETIEWNLNEN